MNLLWEDLLLVELLVELVAKGLLKGLHLIKPLQPQHPPPPVQLLQPGGNSQPISHMHQIHTIQCLSLHPSMEILY